MSIFLTMHLSCLYGQTTHTVSVRVNQPDCNPLSVGNSLVIKAYPNPVDNYMSINGVSGATQVSILDLTGRTMKEKENLGDGTIFLGDLPSGVYFIRIYDAQTSDLQVIKVRRK